jgi:periplasmic divalent cation tolerance protein
MAEHIVVTCSAPTRTDALSIARALLADRLAACVQLVEIDSLYVWKEALEHTPEVLLVIKTRASRYDALEARIRALHTYETPEIIAVPVERGLPEYLGWIDAVT